MAAAAVTPRVSHQQKTGFLLRDSVARDVVLSLLLVLATTAVYAPVHNHPFANIDDSRYVAANIHIKDGLNAQVVLWAFTHGYAGNWHPLTWISHALDIQMFGLDPAGHHDENVAFHALNALLLFWVLKRATGYTLRSFMVAALFALHPINVESVAWIAERKTMLSTLFCLLALGAYRWYARKPGGLRYSVMAGWFVLGLLSKPQIIMLPLVFLAWDYWPLGRLFVEDRKRASTDPPAIPTSTLPSLIKEKIPLFFICVVDAAVTVIAQHVNGSPQPYTLGIRLGNALVSYVKYVGKAFWPTNLALYYVHPGRSLTLAQAGAALVGLAAITVLAARARRHRYLIVGWLFFLIMLLPMIGLVQVDIQGMADRYAYVSFIGLFIMVCWGLPDLVTRCHLPHAVLPLVSVVAFAALAALTYRQIAFWQDDVTLWQHAVSVNQSSWKAHFLLGVAQRDAGQPDQAIQSYLQAAALFPWDPFVNQNIADYEFTHNHLLMAIEYYKRVVPQAWTDDQRASALQNMSVAYRRLGDPADADACMARVKALPQSQVNWQGAWWTQIVPMLKERLHMAAGK